IDKVEKGEMPIAWLSGPGGCGKTHAARGAIKAFEKRGLSPIFCNPSSYRDVLSTLKSAKVFSGNKLVGKRLVVMEEADVIFRSDKCLNLLKIATDRAGLGQYDGVDVRVPMMVTTNAPLDELAATDKRRGEHLRALFNRVPPMTISYDRRANYDYAVSLALTTDLLRFTPAKQQISRATVARALEKFTSEFNRFEILTARTLSNIAEYYTTFSPQTAETMIERLFLPSGEVRQLPPPPQSDWIAVIDEAVQRRRAIRLAAKPHFAAMPQPVMDRDVQPIPRLTVVSTHRACDQLEI
ncbi:MULTISPECIES: ATP-binding protein, partial [unclassified Novosphingobium]|uniref:ATP-binding protein n=1 Tax=unclassified Novosphingobium TaxID=2644732 RepID=UPI001359F6AE